MKKVKLLKLFISSNLTNYKATLAYMVFVIAVNALFSYLPLFYVFEQAFSPVDFLVGFVFVFRDFAQREIGHYVLFPMLLAGAISYALADPTVAVASIMAFIVAELMDWAVFTWTKKPLQQRLLFSSIISAPVDTAVFLYFMNHPYWLEFFVVTAAKILGAVGMCYLWKFRTSRQPDFSTTG